MQTRALRQSDLIWVVNELRELPKQSERYKDVPDDVEYVYNYLSRGSVNGVVMPDTRSFLLYSIAQPWYQNIRQAHEVIMWVPEQFRGGRSAYSLIKAYIAEARQHVDEIHAGHSLDITSRETTLRLYEKCGFTRDSTGVILRIER